MRTLARIPLVALALGLAAASLTAGPVEDGEEALRQGRPELAMKFFKIAIQVNPDDSRAWAGYTAATKAGAGSSAGSSAPSLPVAPARPPAPVAGVPVAGGMPIADAESESTPEVDTDKIATSYLKGKPIFYAEGIKKLLRGRRVESSKVAERTYEQQKEEMTRYYLRKRGGKLGVSATLFTPRLYAYLAALRASKEKLGQEGALEIWEQESDKSFRLLEFYVVFKNLTYEGGILSKQRLADIDDVENKIFLEDDKGIRYTPYKTVGPDEHTVKDFQQMTVWFAPVNRNGTPLWENSVSEMRLVIEGVRGEAKRITFPFAKNIFRRMVQVNG